MVEETSLQLIAKVTGLPRPKVTWFRNEVEIMPTPSNIIKYEKDEAKLKISPVKMSQEGTYKCVASNPAGEDTCVAKVTVEGQLIPDASLF